MALFRVDFSSRGELAERQQKLAQMLSRLQKISEGLATALADFYGNYGNNRCTSQQNNSAESLDFCVNLGLMEMGYF